MQFVRLGDLIVNLANVVALDLDGQNVVRIWYTGSDKPVPLQTPVPGNQVLKFLSDRGLLA